MSETVQTGDYVIVKYTGKYESGEIFDQSKDKPLEFITGKQMVIKGFDEAVIGMKKNQKKTITLTPQNAYGDSNPALIQTVPKNAFGENASKLQKGMSIGLNHPTSPGQVLPALVKEVNQDTVVLDLNHPLAGKTLIFDIEVIDFHKATPEEIERFFPTTTSCDGNCSTCGHNH